MARGNLDDTVRIGSKPTRRRRSRLLPFAEALIVLAALACAVVLLWPDGDGPATPRLADEAEIDADQPTTLTAFRVRAWPAIVVLDFPDLQLQGEMLDRIAALIEKDGLPHDRVLDDAALDSAIRADGDTPADWYLGHDYSAAEIARFFALADADAIRLDPEELELRRLVRAWRGERYGFGALITLSRAGPGLGVDAADRHIILHHELSHGFYFSDPAYRASVASVWRDVLTGAERDDVRAYLKAQEYDPALTDLMMNEMQAYLVYTPPGRFFDPSRLGISPERRATIRDALRTDGPTWLAPAN